MTSGRENCGIFPPLFMEIRGTTHEKSSRISLIEVKGVWKGNPYLTTPLYVYCTVALLAWALVCTRAESWKNSWENSLLGIGNKCEHGAWWWLPPGEFEGQEVDWSTSVKKAWQQLVEETFVRAKVWDFPMGQVGVMEGTLTSCRGESSPASRTSVLHKCAPSRAGARGNLLCISGGNVACLEWVQHRGPWGGQGGYLKNI